MSDVLSQPALIAPATTLDVLLDVEDGSGAVWDEPPIRTLVTAIVAAEVPPGAYVLSVHLVSEETMHTLNQEHRGVDSATDVLSFPLHDPHGMRFVLPPDQPVVLGDVVISEERVLDQAHALGHSPERERAYLVAHGVLHILGYDHENADDQLRMRTREEQALAPLGFTR